MNALRTASIASRFVRNFFTTLFAAAIFAGLFTSASLAGMKPAPTHGLGAALALIAQVRTMRAQANAVADGVGNTHASNGRTLINNRLMRPGAILKSRASANVPVPISSAVQTYDVFNPPPGFRPLIGFQGPNDANGNPTLNNSTSNPPVYVSTLTPINLTPVWSRDETFLVFSSNRTANGGVQADGRFHLWAISVNGGEAFQITGSTGMDPNGAVLPAGGGEFFPALSSANDALAFTSDAQSAGTQNLYVIPSPSFSFNILSSLNNSQPLLNVANPAATSSQTLRASTEAASAALTGFDQVQRPTFSPNQNQLIVFSAHSVSGTNAGHYHIYFLYTSNLGFDQNNQSFPGKLTDGPADDTDPTYSPDGQFIAFASTANAVTRQANGMNSLGPNPPNAVQDPNQSQSITTVTAGNTKRGIYVISGGGSGNGAAFGTVPPQLQAANGRVTLAGNDDFGPAWSNFGNQNQYTNPSGNFGYLAFARQTATAATHEIYYVQFVKGISSPSTEKEFSETAAGGTDVALQLNTDDPTGTYDHAYPAWSPFVSIFSITYTSNRTVTYNGPVTGFPRETAASVEGGHVNGVNAASGYDVASNYVGILISQVLNLDPPTLLRFSANEVVHVQAAGALDGSGNSADPVGGTPNKLAVSGGQKVTLTVRLSDREAGIDDTGGPNGGPRVYVQLKDPDSKYQDSQFTEHKVFARDRFFNGQANQAPNDVNSGTANIFLGNPTPQGYGDFTGVTPPARQKYTYPSYGPTVSTPNDVGPVNPRGAHGGNWFFPDNDNPADTYIFVGRDGGGTNPYPFDKPAGGDPAQFIPLGPEYEAQLVNPQFATSGNPNAPGDTTAAGGGVPVGDYTDPFWLAGVDDQGAFSGGVYSGNTGASNLPVNGGQTQPDGIHQTDRPTANFNDGTNNRPAEWLQLKRIPDGAQDHLGGVLYTVTWTTPNSGSDFFIDVIAYDKAVFPNLPAGTSSSIGQKTNWRIYDNVGGFSTNQSIGNNDILVVSDYALGQKFAATTFGGRNSNLNLVPKLFGAESYLTDVDVNTLPDSVYAGLPNQPSNASPASYVFLPVLQHFYSFIVFGNDDVHDQNGLGVGSYYDDQIDDGNKLDGRFNVVSQRYSIWRILSRGPVPQTVLKSYLPTKVQQPAIQDPSTASADAAYTSIPAATVLEAPRCVVWLSPFTGDVLSDPGSLDDPGTVGQPGVSSPRQSTTSILTNFVQSGGRLFVTGQDVGSTLTLGGAINNAPSGNPAAPNFLPDVLNASLASTGTATHVLAATDNRITGNPQYDHSYQGRYLTETGKLPGPFFIFEPNYPFQDNLVIGDPDFADSGLTQIPPLTLPTGASIQGQPDTINALNGAQVAVTYGAGGATALVFHDDPFGIPKAGAAAGQLPNGGTGSRVVYAAFGLEALSNDYYSSDCPHPTPTQNPDLHHMIPLVIPRNPRPAILHNIVNYLRTGRISGTITQTSGTGQGAGLGIDGATVYLRPLTGNAPPTRAAFSALTANGGKFTIFGVEPGTYTLVSYKPGFSRAVSNTGVSFTLEGDVAKTGATLTLTPLPPGNIAGAVKDTTGTLINGATVTFTSQDNSITKTVTSLNGSVTGSTTENYFLQNVPVTNYTATVATPLNGHGKPEYTTPLVPDPPFDKNIAVAASGTTQPVNFTLTPIPATVTGRIYDAAAGDTVAGGALLAGAIVTLTDSKGTPVGTPAIAGADGTYTLTGIPAAQTSTTYTITATKAGYKTTGNTLSVTVVLGDTLAANDVGLVPIAPGVLTGTVTDSVTSQPVSGAVVTFVSSDGTVTKTATADSSGNYTIPAVPPGTYSATAVGPNNPNGHSTAAGGAAQTVTVASAPPSVTANFTVTTIKPTISGKITDNAATPNPLVKAIVTVTDNSATAAKGTVVATTQTDASGNYSFTLPAGQYTVTLTASLVGFAPQTVPTTPVTIYNGDAITQNLALVPASPGSISGQVFDAQTSAPVVGAVVTFVSVDGTKTLVSQPTDASGAYIIQPGTTLVDPAGNYTGTVATPINGNGQPEYVSPSATLAVTIPPGAAKTGANFTLTEIPAIISGTVTDAQTGRPLAGASVALTNSAGTAVATKTTDANGNYSFNPAPATQTAVAYTLVATVPTGGYFPGSLATTPATISLGDQLAAQNIPLNEQVTVYGLVTDNSALIGAPVPLAGVTVTVTDAATGGAVTTIPTPLTTAAAATTGPDGKPVNYEATFVVIPGHSYTVSVAKASFDPGKSVSIMPVNGVPVRADLQLTSSIGLLGGLVTDAATGAIVPGATITVTNSTTAAVVATLTSNGATAMAPDGKAANYQGQVTEGTYTVTLTKGDRAPVVQTGVKIGGGQFRRLDFTSTTTPATGLPALYTFPAGLQFVSTPYDYSSLGFDGLFGTLGVNRSHVAVWDPTVGAYALDPNPPADTLRLGTGYWIYLKTPTPVTQQGASPTTPYVPISLHPFWNQIGVPNPTTDGKGNYQSVPVTSLLFDDGKGGTISFSQAISDLYHVASPTLYSFDGTSYQPVSASGSLSPWKAYWIKVYANATLEFPTQLTK